MLWFGPEWISGLGQIAERASVPVNQSCERCGSTIWQYAIGILMWHIGLDGSRYRPYHWACHMRMVIGGINHVLRHGKQGCSGECGPDPDWLPADIAAQIALQIWQYAPEPRTPDAIHAESDGSAE